jgi:hypothetical protein
VSDAVLVAVIAAVGLAVNAVISAFAYRAARETHLSVNSRMDQLLRVARAAARAEGEQAQRDRDEAK